MIAAELFRGGVSPSPAPLTLEGRQGRSRAARNIFSAFAWILVLAPSLLYGQVDPKRLSDWLLEQPPAPNAYPLGLSWRVPGEVPAQNELRLQLLQRLSDLPPRSSVSVSYTHLTLPTILRV